MCLLDGCTKNAREDYMLHIKMILSSVFNAWWTTNFPMNRETAVPVFLTSYMINICKMHCCFKGGWNWLSNYLCSYCISQQGIQWHTVCLPDCVVCILSHQLMAELDRHNYLPFSCFHCSQFWCTWLFVNWIVLWWLSFGTCVMSLMSLLKQEQASLCYCIETMYLKQPQLRFYV